LEGYGAAHGPIDWVLVADEITILIWNQKFTVNGARALTGVLSPLYLPGGSTVLCGALRSDCFCFQLLN